MDAPRSNDRRRLLIAALAAFCTYFCMYAFRKPFTAGTYDGQEVFGLGLKSLLVVSQIAGYMLSKFIGIKVVSEMRTEYRAVTIVGLILAAELALVGFAFAPALPIKACMLFLNGLPLGMVFGLVLAYLEGRRQTEALSAVLCASFIISSGVVKSVGRWLIEVHGVSEFFMPMLTGLIFLPPLLVSVLVLQATPAPDNEDIQHRSARQVMSRADRRQFLMAYWPGLSQLVFVYIALSVIRTVRDDFGVEIWRDMGVAEEPSVFAKSELVVGLIVTLLSGLAIWIKHHRTAIRVTTGMMCAAFVLVAVSGLLQPTGAVSPFAFMVACGIGLYVPYVAFHTTMFERLIAASGRPSNLGFLMYVADAMGYLGYTIVIVWHAMSDTTGNVLPFFRAVLLIGAVASILALIVALRYFQRALSPDAAAEEHLEATRPIEELAPVE